MLVKMCHSTCVQRTLTLNRVSQILTIDVRRNQMAIIVFHLPFVVDDIFQCDFRATMIMRASTADHNHVSAIRFVRMLLVAALEYAANKRNRFCEFPPFRLKIAQTLKTYTFAKSASSFDAIIFDESITVSRKYLHSFDK